MNEQLTGKNDFRDPSEDVMDEPGYKECEEQKQFEEAFPDEKKREELEKSYREFLKRKNYSEDLTPEQDCKTARFEKYIGEETPEDEAAAEKFSDEGVCSYHEGLKRLGYEDKPLNVNESEPIGDLDDADEPASEETKATKTAKEYIEEIKNNLDRSRANREIEEEKRKKEKK